MVHYVVQGDAHTDTQLSIDSSHNSFALSRAGKVDHLL